MTQLVLGGVGVQRGAESSSSAEAQADTRRRIVEATVALHEEVGPARTTVADVARRAGVGRVTVYNHFPDEAELLGACSAHFIAAHPPPDPTPWAAIGDPEARLSTALHKTYAYYRANHAMIGNVTRDAALLPALAAVLREGGADAHETALKDLLTGPYDRAAVSVALAFATWQRLTSIEGLSDERATEVMVRAVTGTLAA